MVNFINRVIMLCLALPLLATVFSDSVEEYHFRYLSNMEDGLKCHEGFKTLSPYVKNAADLCAKEKIMASFLCFITCTYRAFEYIKPGTDAELDYGMADFVTQDSFDVTTPAGWKSYREIATKRYYCGLNFTSKGTFKFAKRYDNATACEDAADFYKCSWSSLTCNQSKFSLKDERRTKKVDLESAE